MKLKYVLLGITTLLLAGVGWIGWNTWLRNHDLVTLNVRNKALQEVVRLVEKQVRGKLSVDPKLDAKVTLSVTRRPLAEVLDLISEQSGARWGKTYAVYGNPVLLPRLEKAMQGDGNLDAAGWTNLAPQIVKQEFKMPAEDGSPGGPVILNSKDGGSISLGSGQKLSPEEIQKLVQEHLKTGDKQLSGGNFKIVTSDEEVTPQAGGNGKVVKIGGPNGGVAGGPMKRVMVRRVQGSNGATTTTTTTSDAEGTQMSTIKLGEDGKIVQEDFWSRERLVMESRLMPQLGDSLPKQATTETAQSTADQVHGKYAVYYAIDKAPAGAGAISGLMNRNFSSNGTNLPKIDLEAMGKDRMLGGLGKLSPEEQVRRAREAKAEGQGTSK